jgi:integrase
MKEKFVIVGTGSYRKRKTGTWECRYTVENIATGEKRKKSLYGPLRRDVAAKFEALKKSLVEETGPAPEHTTLAGWMDEWLSVYKAQSIRPGTREKYRLIIENKIKPGLGSCDLRTLDESDIQEFLNGLSPALAGKQINEVRAILLAALDRATERELIPSNPCRRTERAAEAHHKIIAMTEREQEAFLQAAKGTRYELFFQLALATGMRRGELMGLRWEDVDPDAGVIHVRQAITKIATKLVEGEVKSQSGVRDIPIAVPIKPTLKASKGAGLVFHYSTGTPINPPYLLRSMRYICKKAGISYYTIKDLRSTFATRAAEKGVNPKVLMAIMGHSDVSVTLKYYTGISQEMKNEAIQKIFGNSSG